MQYLCIQIFKDFWEKLEVHKSSEQISDNIITEKETEPFFSYWIFVHCDLDMYDI